MSMSTMVNKGDYESKQKVEKKENERKKAILVLMNKYLINLGFCESAVKLQEESNLDLDRYELADNIDLYIIVREFEDFFFMKYSRNPKYISKLPESSNNLGHNLPRIGTRDNKSTGTKRVSTNNKKKTDQMSTKAQGNSTTNSNGNDIQNGNDTNNGTEVKLELNINHLTKGKNSKGNGNKDDEKNKFSFNDHKESILLKPLPLDFPEELKELAALVKREIILENPNVTFNDIVGLEAPKAIIEEALLWPMKYPQFFTGLLEPWKGILLFGPPGTGKTLLAKAVATEMRSTFFNISAATVVSKWRGDSEKIIKVLFDLARHYQPSTIFLDEIDSIMSKRGNSLDEHEGSRRMKTELLIQLDGLCKNEGVFLLAASNIPWELDPALLRRLEKRVIVTLPDLPARIQMLKHFIPEKSMKGIIYDSCGKVLEGYSGSDIKLVCKEALMTRTRKAIVQIERDSKGKMFNVNDFPVEKEDFDDSVTKVKPAYIYKTEEYEKWMKAHGSS